MPNSSLRAMTSADIAGGLRLSHASGWNQLAEDWQVFFESPGSGGFLVERDGAVLGTSAYIRYDSLAWVAMMLVDPDERRSGLGSRLLEAALEALRGVKCVGLDATPLGLPLYRRHGFVEHSQLSRMKGIVDAGRFADMGGARAMQSARHGGDLAARSAGVRRDRGRLLESLWRRAPECAWVLRGDAGGRSYCFGRPGRLYHQVGPIVAADAGVARDLAAACLAGMAGRSVAIDVPRYDAEWIDYLRSAGFVEERPFTRMFLGGQPVAHPGIPARQYAICGPEFA